MLAITLLAACASAPAPAPAPATTTTTTPMPTVPVTPTSGTNPAPSVLAYFTWTNADGGLAVVGDVTGDGHQDAILTTRPDLHYVRTLVPGPLAEDKDVALVGIPLGGPRDILAVGDVDGDGIGDLLFATDGWTVGLVRGPVGANPIPEAGVVLPPDELVSYATVGDLDDDGVNEVVMPLLQEDGDGQYTCDRVEIWSAPFDPASFANPRVVLSSADDEPGDYYFWSPGFLGPHDLDGDGVLAYSILGGGGTSYTMDSVLDATASGDIAAGSESSGYALELFAPIPLWDLTGDGVPEFLEVASKTSIWTGPRQTDADDDPLSAELGSPRSWVNEFVTKRDPLRVDFDGDGVSQLVGTSESYYFDDTGPELKLARGDLDGLLAEEPIIEDTWAPPGADTLWVWFSGDLDGDGRGEVLVTTSADQVHVLYTTP